MSDYYILDAGTFFVHGDHAADGPFFDQKAFAQYLRSQKKEHVNVNILGTPLQKKISDGKEYLTMEQRWFSVASATFEPEPIRV